MNTQEIKIESSLNIPTESADEKRLNAIKKILVGNQIERIENRFRGLSRRVESTNSHLVSIIEELNQEMAALKMSSNSSSSAKQALSPEVEKLIQDFVNAKKGGKLAEGETINILEARLKEVELNIDHKLNDKSQAINAEVQSFKETITNKQSEFAMQVESRLGELEDSVSAHDQIKVNSRLSSLEEEIKSLRGKGQKALEQKLVARQNDFENDVQDLVERLAGRVNERFDFASDERKRLNAGLNEAADERKALSNQINGLQKVVENDVVAFMRESISNTQNLNERLSSLENKDAGSLNTEALAKLSSELERKLYENNIRMEAKVDAIYDLTQRQLAGRKEDNSKKEALRETLKKLSQLLDE